MSEKTSVSNLRQYRFKKDAMKASTGNAGYKLFSSFFSRSYYVCVCVCSMRSSCVYRFANNIVLILLSALDAEYKLVPGRKRIHAPADSSSDEGQNSPTKPPTLSVKEKELRLIKLRHSEPDYDTMVNVIRSIFAQF